MSENKNNLIELGVITGPHGIQGAVLIKPFGETPLDQFSEFTDQDGTRQFKISKMKSNNKGRLIASLPGVKTRNDAEELKGTILCVDRSALPAPGDEEFYYRDLIGLKAKFQNEDHYGEVISVANHGAGDILEILPQNSQTSVYLVFTKETVPEIKIEDGYIIINPPDEVEAGDTPENEPQ